MLYVRYYAGEDHIIHSIINCYYSVYWTACENSDYIETCALLTGEGVELTVFAAALKFDRIPVIVSNLVSKDELRTNLQKMEEV